MTFCIGRREFITLIGGAAAAWPLAARAQHSAGIRRVGMLINLSETDLEAQRLVTAFREGLTQLGWVDGRNLRIDYRWAAGDVGRIKAFARELVELSPDVIVGYGTPTVLVSVRKHFESFESFVIQSGDLIREGLGKPLRSPDHYAVNTPAVPGGFSTPVRRSRGFEGMAVSKDGKFLYPLLEGPLWIEAEKKWETGRDGREYLRVLEFDIARSDWTGRSWKYRVEENGNNIGDFNMIDADTGLIIERDTLEGLPEDVCSGPLRPDCYQAPAKFKRVYKISLKDADANGFVKKIGYVDLLDIKDPNGVAKRGTKDGVFKFPFVTIENVDVVDGEHIVVANDNNLPYSAGRKPNVQDDNEFILLRVPDLLGAR